MSVAKLASFLMCKDTFGFKQMNSKANNEAPNLWRNSLVMLGLLTANIIINHRFVSRFVSLRAPLGTDPCDGVGLFAGITIVYRSWLHVADVQRSHPSAPLRYLYIVRSQQAVLFAMFISSRRRSLL